MLLASPSASGPLARVDDPEWRDIRLGLVERLARSLTSLHDRGLVLRSDPPSSAKAHWLTPVFEPRRYDTWFFGRSHASLSRSPTGRPPRPTIADWFVPSELLRAYAAGSASPCSRPTVICVEEIRDVRLLLQRWSCTRDESAASSCPSVATAPDGGPPWRSSNDEVRGGGVGEGRSGGSCLAWRR